MICHVEGCGEHAAWLIDAAPDEVLILLCCEGCAGNAERQGFEPRPMPYHAPELVP